MDLREEASEKQGCVKLIYVVSDTGIGAVTIDEAVGNYGSY